MGVRIWCGWQFITMKENRWRKWNSEHTDRGQNATPTVGQEPGNTRTSPFSERKRLSCARSYFTSPLSASCTFSLLKWSTGEGIPVCDDHNDDDFFLMETFRILSGLHVQTKTDLYVYGVHLAAGRDFVLDESPMFLTPLRLSIFVVLVIPVVCLVCSSTKHICSWLGRCAQSHSLILKCFQFSTKYAPEELLLSKEATKFDNTCLLLRLLIWSAIQMKSLVCQAS